jgi:hypothetical protein
VGGGGVEGEGRVGRTRHLEELRARVVVASDHQRDAERPDTAGLGELLREASALPTSNLPSGVSSLVNFWTTPVCCLYDGLNRALKKSYTIGSCKIRVSSKPVR